MSLPVDETACILLGGINAVYRFPNQGPGTCSVQYSASCKSCVNRQSSLDSRKAIGSVNQASSFPCFRLLYACAEVDRDEEKPSIPHWALGLVLSLSAAIYSQSHTDRQLELSFKLQPLHVCLLCRSWLGEREALPLPLRCCPWRLSFVLGWS